MQHRATDDVPQGQAAWTLNHEDLVVVQALLGRQTDVVEAKTELVWLKLWVFDQLKLRNDQTEAGECIHRELAGTCSIASRISSDTPIPPSGM